jgi:tetratricopeptide (TPR) repeat protein
MSLFLTAYAMHQAGRFQEAADGYLQVLAHEPEHADALHLLGLLRSDAGDLAGGEALMRRALAQSEAPVYLVNLGNLLLKQARLEEAEAMCRRAVELGPCYMRGYYTLGNVLMERQRFVEAEAAFLRALEIDPHATGVMNNLGTIYVRDKRFSDADAVFRRALEVDPHLVHTHYNLGLLMLRTDRPDEAEPALRQALVIDPAHVDARNNLGTALRLLERPAQAEAAYHEVLGCRPDFADAHWNLAILLLAQGRYEEGWPHGEFRYRAGRTTRADASVPQLHYPQWQGQALIGKSLAIWPEQGYGDYLQFVRYVPLLKARGVKHLTLICPEPLAALLATVDGVDEVTTSLKPARTYDYWSFFMSLPLYLGTTVDTIPASLPYLRAPPARLERWRNRLPAEGFKVGLVWRGFTGHQNDDARSLPGLMTLAPLWSVPGVRFISLQKGAAEEEAARAPAHLPVMPVGPDLADFADTAAVIAQLDLVITVDTAVAHLAGALGKSCWVLLSKYWTDWRWMQSRSDSPWYPQALRLFRQSRPGDWDEVVRQVVAALDSRVAQAQAGSRNESA